MAPYTHHCVRTAFIFHLGLVNAVVGTKDTNRIDLEYLYYTPFCNCFSSGDKFLIALSAVTMSADQVFIPETQLKADFKELAKLWRNFTPEEFQAEEVRVGPPDNPASVTYQIWQKYMKLGYRQSKRPQRSPEMDRLLMEKLKRILDASSSGKPVDLAGQDGLSFSMRTRTMRLNGPCFCGGLKTFGECHGVGLKPS